MKSVTLMPRGNEPGPITARPLRIQVSDAVTCLTVRRGVVAEGLLAAVEDETLELDVYGGEFLSAWLARDNLFLAEAQRGQLDERGVIRHGTWLGWMTSSRAFWRRICPSRAVQRALAWPG